MTVFQSIDPATGETVWEGPAASAAEVQAAADRARAAFPIGPTTRVRTESTQSNGIRRS